MNRKGNCQAMGKALCLGLILLLALTACGKSVKALHEAGDVQGLITVLNDANAKGPTRKEAALALGVIGEPAAVEPLIRYLQECADGLAAGRSSFQSEQDWQACFDAVKPVSQILGKLGDTRAVEPLIGMLENHWVHDEAVQALGMLQDARAILPLIVSIDQGLGQFDEVEKRWAAVEPIVLKLAAQATPETFESLREALPGFKAEKQDATRIGERCRKYRLALFALEATQDPRLEALLLSRLETFDSDCDLDVPSMIARLYDYNAAKLLPFIKRGYPEDFAVIYFQITPTPKPINVDFVSIYEYSSYTQVVITGLLSVGPVVSCNPDCNVLLENPLNSSEEVSIMLHLQSQVGGLKNPYD